MSVAANNTVELFLQLNIQAFRQALQQARNGLQSALGGIPGAANQAGNAMQSAMSHAGAAASQAAHAAQAGATSALHSVQQTATQAGHAVQQTATQAGNAAASMGQQFAKVASTIGAMFFVQSSIAEFASFDDAMLKVQALSKATGDEFEALKAKAEELGASTKFTASDAAAGMSQLAAAGYDTSQILDAIGPAMYAAAAGGSDLGETADQLTNIMGAFGLEASEAGKVSDVLVEGFTGAATTLSQLANAMKPAGSISRALGYSLEETVAVLQSLANVGYKGEMAGTALRGGLARLLKPTKEATDALKKYGVEVRDSEGNIRKFSDIIRDLGAAGVDATAMIDIFGQEAGPAMQALVSQGAKAIEDYERKLKSAGGRAKEVSDHMESGLGGALRRLDAAWSQFKNSFGAAIAPAVRQLADALAAVAGWFAAMPDWVKQAMALGAVMIGFAGSLGVIVPVVKLAAGGFVTLLGVISPLFAPLASLTANTIAYAQGVALLGGRIESLKFVLKSLNSLALAAFGGWVVGNWLNQFDIVRKAGVALAAGLEKAFLRVKMSWAWVSGGDVEAIRRELEQVDRIYGEMFAEIERGTDEYKQKQKAAQKEVADSAKKLNKEVTDDAKKNNAERVADAEDAAKEAAQAYKKYADEVRRLGDEIGGRQKSLTAELRDMAAGYIKDDARRWVYQRNQAKEYIASAKQAAKEAQAAFAAGDTITAAAKWKEAVAYADDAKNAYKSLNREVSVNGKVVIDEYTALRGAMNGVKEAGALGISILKQQQQAAKDAAQALEKQHGFEALTADMDAAEKKWAESMRSIGDSAAETAKQVYNVFQNAAGFFTNVKDEFSAGWSKGVNEFTANWEDGYARFERMGKAAADVVNKAIDKAARDRETTIRIRTQETRRWGGLIGDALRYATGGKLPGYGGGDRVSALLEAGEYVVRKEAVKKFGVGLFDALNHLRMPDLSAFMPRIPQAAFAAPGRTVNINLNLGGETYPMQTDEHTAKKIERWYALRSSNRLTRNDYR